MALTDPPSRSPIQLLIEMLQQVDSPLDWSMRLSKISPQSAQRPLDAFFRLLFIAAGKVLECDNSHGKQMLTQERNRP